MKLDLNEIATHLRKRIEYEVNEPPLEDSESGVKCVEPVVGKLVFQNTGTLIVIRGNIHTVIELQCTRCMKPFNLELAIPVEEEFSISGELMWNEEEGDYEGEFPEESQEPLFQDNIFNLTELIRQSLAVSIPIRTVCSEDCRGICPKCGKDLSEGPCDCRETLENSPFAALSSLLEEDKKEDNTD